MLPMTMHSHTHRLEQQVTGEELHGNARHAPNVRLLVPLHAQQHLRRAVLAGVDGALAPLVAVRGTAIVDHYASVTACGPTRHVRAARQQQRLSEVILHVYASASTGTTTVFALHGGEQQVLQLQIRVGQAEVVQELQRLQQLHMSRAAHRHILQNRSDVRHGEGQVVALLQHVVEAAAQQVHHHAVVSVELELVKSDVKEEERAYRW